MPYNYEYERKMNYEKDLCVQFYHYRGAGWTAGLGFVIIRIIEKAIGKGVDAAADAAAKAYRKHKEQNGDKK